MSDQDVIAMLIDYVQRVLATSHDQPVAVYDASGSEEWAAHHAAVVATFADRYRIEPDPERAGGWLFWRKD